MSHFKRKDSTSHPLKVNRKRFNEVSRAWSIGWGLTVASLVLNLIYMVSSRWMEISKFIYIPITLGLVLGLTIVVFNHRERKHLYETRRVIDPLYEALDRRVGRAYLLQEKVLAMPGYGFVVVDVRVDGWQVKYFRVGDDILSDPAFEFGVLRDKLYDFKEKETVVGTPLNRSFIQSATTVLAQGTAI